MIYTIHTNISFKYEDIDVSCLQGETAIKIKDKDNRTKYMLLSEYLEGIRNGKY